MALPSLNLQFITTLSPAAQLMAFQSYVETAFAATFDQPQDIWHSKVAWVKSGTDMGLPPGKVPAQIVFSFRPPQGKAQRLPPEGRTARPLSQHAIILTSGDPVTDTLETPRVTFEADMLGVLQNVPRDLRRTEAKFPDQLCADLLRNGKTVKDYRGEFFFATSKVCSPEGMVTDTFNNLNVNNGLTENNLANSCQQMAVIKGGDGLPMGLRATQLIIPYIMEHDAVVATQIKNIIFAGGGANQAPGQTAMAQGSAMGDSPMATVLKYIKEVVTCDNLENTDAINSTTWYLQDGRDKNGLLVGMFSPAEYVALMDPRDYNVFMRDSYIWGYRMRVNADYGVPQKLQRNEQ